MQNDVLTILQGDCRDTLRKARLRWQKGDRTGIQHIRFEGGDIRYKREHVEAYIKAREVNPMQNNKPVWG